MLTIRNDQLRAFEPARQARFADELEAHFRTHFPQWNVDDLRALLADQVDASRSLGLTSPTDILRYVSLAGTLGFDFAAEARTAWILPALRVSDGTSPTHRLERVLVRLKSEMRRRAASAAALAAFEGR